MFKDYDKYLSTSLKVYLFVLVIIFIMKMVGLDYFGFDVNNKIIISTNEFLENTKLIYLLDFITLFIMFYIYMSIVCDSKKVIKESLIFTLIEFLLQVFLMEIGKNSDIRYYIDFIILMVSPIFVNKKLLIKKPLIIILLITFYQLISYSIRGQSINSNYNNKIVDMLLNIDQYILLIITYKVYFMKGVEKQCQEAGYSSLKKINLKKSLKKLQKNWRKYKKNFKEHDKVTKLSNIIYLILSIFWNTFTIVTVFVAAFLNDTFIECIFIVTSFWLSKGKFGKPFHLKSMTHCFIVSNLTYYVLNRITTPLGISIIIPIMLGVGLSYVTSKLVKKTYKPLYRGMPEDLFEETILKVTDKDSEKYAICYDFYINKKSTVAISMKYNYSEAGIRKIKDRINNKIKEL